MFSVQIQQGVKYNQHFVAVTFKIVFKNKQIGIYIQGLRFIWAWFYVGLQACVNVHGGIPGAFDTGTNKLFLSSYIVWEGGGRLISFSRESDSLPYSRPDFSRVQPYMLNFTRQTKEQLCTRENTVRIISAKKKKKHTRHLPYSKRDQPDRCV